MKKKILIAVAVALLIIAGGVGFKLTQKSTQEILQSKTWTFNADKNDGTGTPTAKFSEKSLTLSIIGLNDVYQYDLKKENNKEKITFTKKDDMTGDKEVREFYISKNNDEFKLQAINNLAKEDTGNVSLIPK
ncbi:MULTISPECIES: hypothetical protein [Lactococcus]|uniref:hypothetical protein n=1 Tax=Lactococcus TaxID=1357 RepID=UPI00071C8D1F|nr:MULTISPECIES: hypothetical protein [Lactococcus]KST98387.1 hypothetical protein KF196_1809 [Lactococcus lactis subsp. lactis]MCT1172045.1 hypothetical protein [Lactococcus lactis]MDR9868045.1 hypothetical protein [Lactococcus cremoris]